MSRIFSDLAEDLTSDAELVTDQCLLKPFFDLKLSLGSVVNCILPLQGSNPRNLGFKYLYYTSYKLYRKIVLANVDQ